MDSLAVITRVRTIPVSGIGYRAILVQVLPLHGYSHATLEYCNVPDQVPSRQFTSPANTTRQLASLFAASTADREALPDGWAGHCLMAGLGTVVRPTRCNVVMMSYDSLMTSYDDVTSRRSVSVLGIGIVAPLVSWYLVAMDGIVLTLVITSCGLLVHSANNPIKFKSLMIISAVVIMIVNFFFSSVATCSQQSL